jgi:hypothetical protein
MPLVALVDFKNYVRDEFVNEDDAVLQAALDAAEWAVGDHCQRTFDVAGAPTARTYRGTNDSVLPIHDAASITSVTVKGVTVTDWQAEPINGIDSVGRAVPFTRLRRVDGIFERLWEDRVPNDIVVTAAYGWPASPPAAVEAVKILAKDIIHQRDNRSGVAGFAEFGAVRVRQNPYVEVLLAKLRRAESWGLA